MKDKLFGFAMLALLVSMLIGTVVYQRMLWNECRETNSWFYCMKVLSR